MAARPLSVVLLLCAAETLSMTAFSTYPALLPVIRDAWGLSNSAAGLVSGTYFGGYMAAVPLLASLTDRVDARRVYAAAALLSAAGALGFALFARALPSALIWQAVAGAGLAGTYMPGLKALADHVEGAHQSRAVSFYTSTFGIGGSLSLWLAGRVASALDWRWAFGLAAIGPVVAALLVVAGLTPRPAVAAAHTTVADDLARMARVVCNRPALAYIAGYAAHCWELFGLRAWMVAFLAFAGAADPGRAMPWAAATVAAAINLLGPPASILGNEVAGRAVRGPAALEGRLRYVATVMIVSVALAAVAGFTSAGWWVLPLGAVALYFVVVMADSAALTAGVVAAALPGERGATMAVYSLAGFGAAFVSPLVFGAALDQAGVANARAGWGIAFWTLALPTILVVPVLVRAGRERAIDTGGRTR